MNLSRSKLIKQILSDYILLFVILVFCLAFLPIGAAFGKSVFITMQFLFIGLFSVVGIIWNSNRYSFSIGMIIWFFFFTFFFCGGVTQFANEAFRWGLLPTESEIILANNLIILWMIVMAVSRNYKKKISIARRRTPLLDRYINISNRKLMPFAALLFLIGAANLVMAGWASLLLRTDYASGIFSAIGSQPIRLLLTTVTRGLSLWVTMLAIHNYKMDRSGSNRIFVIMMLVISILNVPPLGIARYVFAAFYGGICIYSFKWLRKRKVLLYALSIGLLVLFPLLNAFRGMYTDVISWDFIIKSTGTITGNFATADYDAYTMLIYTIRYVASNGITHGRQLLGVMLFFVPSSLWLNKPIGSGATIFHNLLVNYNPNVSCPIIGEGYINFGILGVILFAIVIGRITNRLDNKYWGLWKDKSAFGELFYCFTIFFFMFLCRGDLMSSFSYLFGYMIALFFIIITLNGKTIRAVNKQEYYYNEVRRQKNDSV